jgi:exosortase
MWLVMSILLVVLYGNVLVKWAIDIWNDSNYSHGLLIPFISLYFFIKVQSRLRVTQSFPDNKGLLFILSALVFFVLASVGGELFIQRVSFVVILYGLVLFLEGQAVGKLLRFPIFLFLFAIPLPYIIYNAIAFPLKLVATQIAASVINVSGIPVFREGNIIHLPHTTLEVVDACSGIRSLMTLVTLAFLFATLQLQLFWKRTLLVILAVPIAVIANATRVTATALLTKYNKAWASGFHHEITGWLAFVISFGLLMGISFILDKDRVKK